MLAFRQSQATRNALNVIVIPQALQDELAAEATAAYPRECCGVIIGRREASLREVGRREASRREAIRKDVTEIAPVENIQPEAIRDYFEMHPKQLSAIEDRVAKADGLDVLGYYHSHPDHPARPSPRDLEAARDVYQFARIHYSYVILACHSGRVVDVTSSVLAEGEQEFEAEKIEA